MEVEADDPRGARRGLATRARQCPANRARQPEPTVELRPADELRLGRTGFARQGLGEGDDFGPRVFRQHERVPRDDADVADLRIPLVALEDRASPELDELRVGQWLDRHPRVRHAGHPTKIRVMTAKSRYSAPRPSP